MILLHNHISCEGRLMKPKVSKSSKLLKEKLKSIRKFRIFVITVFILCDLLSLLQPYVLGKIIDNLGDGGKEVIHLVMFGLALLLISFILNYIQNYNWFKMMKSANMIGRNFLLTEVLKQNFAFFKKFNNGDISNRILIDSANLTDNITVKNAILLLNISTLVIVFSLMFSLDVVISTCILIFSIFYFLYYRLINKQLRKLSKKERESYSELMDRTNEILEGVETIQQNQSEAYFEKRYIDSSHKQLNYEMHLQKWKSLALTSTQFVMDILPWLIIGLGAYRVLHGQTSLGVLFSFFAYKNSLNQPIYNLSELNLNNQRSKAIEDRLDEIIKDSDSEPKNLTTINDVQNLQFKNLSFSYDGERSIFNRLNSSFRKNDVVFVSGKSGSGKTTLTRLLLKQLEPSQGQILLDNIDLLKVDHDNYYSNISIMPQDVFIFNGSKLDNITMGHHYSSQSLNKVLSLPFIKSISDGDVSSYSGGEKQRIALARLALRDTDIVLLDEPTSALDRETEKEVMTYLISNVFKDKIVFIISHNPEMKKYCNKYLSYEDGDWNFRER